MIFENRFMKLAMDEAHKASEIGEVPVGAVIVKNGEVISSAHNLVETENNSLLHAEMIAIRRASDKLQDKYLNGCHLYVTLEPCAMCATAISHARISRLYYAASDQKSGGIESGPKIFSQDTIHHKPEIYSGIMQEEAKKLLQEFFQKLRSR